MLFFGLRREFRVWALTIFQPSRRAEDGLSATRVGLYGSRAEASRAIESIAATPSRPTGRSGQRNEA